MLLVFLALAIGLAIASSSSTHPNPTPAPGPVPLPAPGSEALHQGVVYQLSWIDTTNAPDPLAQSAALVVAGWVPQEPLKGPAAVQAADAQGNPVGAPVNGWQVHALRIGPTLPATPDVNGGLSAPLIIVEITGPDLPVPFLPTGGS